MDAFFFSFDFLKTPCEFRANIFPHCLISLPLLPIPLIQIRLGIQVLETLEI